MSYRIVSQLQSPKASRDERDQFAMKLPGLNVSSGDQISNYHNNNSFGFRTSTQRSPGVFQSAQTANQIIPQMNQRQILPNPGTIKVHFSNNQQTSSRNHCNQRQLLKESSTGVDEEMLLTFFNQAEIMQNAMEGQSYEK